MKRIRRKRNMVNSTRRRNKTGRGRNTTMKKTRRKKSDISGIRKRSRTSRIGQEGGIGKEGL